MDWQILSHLEALFGSLQARESPPGQGNGCMVNESITL
jgi:hypothetical protein